MVGFPILCREVCCGEEMKHENGARHIVAKSYILYIELLFNR